MHTLIHESKHRYKKIYHVVNNKAHVVLSSVYVRSVKTLPGESLQKPTTLRVDSIATD